MTVVAADSFINAKDMFLISKNTLDLTMAVLVMLEKP